MLARWEFEAKVGGQSLYLCIFPPVSVLMQFIKLPFHTAHTIRFFTAVRMFMVDLIGMSQGLGRQLTPIWLLICVLDCTQADHNSNKGLEQSLLLNGFSQEHLIMASEMKILSEGSGSKLSFVWLLTLVLDCFIRLLLWAKAWVHC